MNSAGQKATYRFAFDIGGTFTDLVLAGSDGSVFTGKVLSDQEQVVAPILEGLGHMLKQHGIQVSQLVDVVAGATTAVTNLIIERKGARTGLITTQGFRDVIEIGRELRYDVYDLTASFPTPIVPRELRMELAERIDAAGEVVQQPDDSHIEKLLLGLREAGVQSIAVCLLHAYRNPAHEQQIREVARRVVPEIALSLSSDVAPEIREYERAIATALNAYVMPMVGTYLSQIETGLKNYGVNAVLQVMQSNGGIISREFGERLPIRMLESGPAAGVLGATHTAAKSACNNVLAFDMGGTTAKACLISDGTPEITMEFEAARQLRFKKGSGFPVRLPVVDLIEIGAGGGSIAYVDQSGLLKVGPRSAGSSPGPACYGLGGKEPTVTDAALVLGYLDPTATLSGVVRLRLDLAEQAIKTHIADPLNLSVTEAASGIHRIVCEHMAAAAKIHAVEKGKDIRRYTLLASGGAGPMHAREVGRRSGCANVLIPSNAGVFSATGLLVAPMKVDIVRTRYVSLADADWQAIEQLYADMARQLREELAAAGESPENIQYSRSADMRYVGQGFEINAGLPPALSTGSSAAVAQGFHQSYQRHFGQALEDQSIEVLNWRLEAVVHRQQPAMDGGAQAAQQASGKRSRQVFYPDINQYTETPVFHEKQLVANAPYHGPALIEQAGSTIVIGPGDRYLLDDAGSIRIALNMANALNQQERLAS